jgi:adenosine kinase
MAALICGSLAFDTIMNFHGRFVDQILPSQLHNLNVSFLVPGLRREYGGCAGNIAYSLRQLGGTPLPMATVGADGADYVARLHTLGISTEFIREIKDHFTAQAMIMTDESNNQITAFHPGAMMQAHIHAVPPREDIRIGIISPDGRDAMLEHAAQFKHAHIPFIFDPGQGLPMFSGDDLLLFLSQATWVTVNDYEGKMLSERTGLDFSQISSRLAGGLVVTLGELGCEVWQNGHRHTVAPTAAQAVVDPTGCGDAFRGALLYGLERGMSLTACCSLGNRVGAIKIAHQGGQNYQLDTRALGLC